MKKLFCLLMCFTFLNAESQTVTPLWAWGHNMNGNIAAIEYHNDFIYTAANFSDSAFVFGNSNIPNNGGKDVVIAKWDTLGNLIWATNIYGSGDEVVADIKMNNNNELVVAVNSNSAVVNAGGNTLNSNGGNDIFICRYNLNGINQSNLVIGTAGYDYAADMCIDYQNNIYLLYGGLKKYTNAGLFVWTSPIYGSHIYFSSFDSTIVTSGNFVGTITYGNSITASGANYDIFTAKTSMGGNPQWLVNTTQSWKTYPGWDDIAETYIDNNTGTIYVCTGTFYQLGGFWNIDLKRYSSQGIAGTQIAITGGDGGETGPWSLSGRDSLISISHSADPYYNDFRTVEIYNIYTNQVVKQYKDVAFSPGFQLFRGLNSIYTFGYENNNFRNFGKIGHGVLKAADSYVTVHICPGYATGYLTGNILGGVAPLTYSWLPVTGLNNTNTNSVSFPIAGSITYTLTVTDAIGQIAKDTFNVLVDTPNTNFNITSQFPVICDSMMLYSNTGCDGSWYKFDGAYFQVLPGQVTTENKMIYSPGLYKFTFYNCFGLASDTIEILAAVNVNANASSDTVCAGQSVTLSGSGANNYSWTGWVQNNIPFVALSTQTYTLTGTDANGCINTSTVKVTVLPVSNSSTTISICANQTPYAWNGQNLIVTGTYTANFLTPNGCDSVATLHLTVSPCIVCVPNFTINYSPFYNSLTESQSWIVSSGNVLILAGDKVKLDANTNSYVTLNPGFKADSGSVFIAQALNGCTAGSPQLPNAKMYNGNTLEENAEIVLYPNPTTGLIHIQHDEKLSNIMIFDMVGKLMINQKCNGETETNIDLSNLPNGVYYVKAVGYESVKVTKSE